ncbi:hypothetical protein X975_22660, partial [Stegodyphus mimosarum]
MHAAHTKRFQNPPHQGSPSTINFHSNPFFPRKFRAFSSLHNLYKYVALHRANDRRAVSQRRRSHVTSL